MAGSRHRPSGLLLAATPGVGRSGGRRCRCGIRNRADGDEEDDLFAIMSRAARAGFALALLCGVAACATGPAKSDAQRQADREMAAHVQDALDADKQLYARHITVRADNGVVRLTGFVWDPPDLNEAKSVAELVPGVSSVVNDLELERNGMDNSGVTR
jgi:hyperosmotically inducible protein